MFTNYIVFTVINIIWLLIQEVYLANGDREDTGPLSCKTFTGQIKKKKKNDKLTQITRRIMFTYYISMSQTDNLCNSELKWNTNIIIKLIHFLNTSFNSICIKQNSIFKISII